MTEPALVTHSSTHSFSERLIAFRARRGITQAGLAVAVNTTAATVRRWEAGTARPSAAVASALTALGMEDITDADTNLPSIARLNASGSRSRTEQALAHREEGKRSFEFTDLIWSIVPSPCSMNGPPDQVAFHDTLLRMQMTPVAPATIPPASYQARLSLVGEVDGKPTSQYLLERPRPTATSWNSNYGSHGWHRYVGRFPPHLVRAILNHFQAQAGDLVLDPFTGSGTTNVECRLLGIPSVGVEISPLSALIARTKSDFPPTASPMLDLSTRLTDWYVEKWSDFVALHKGVVPDHRTVLRRQGNLIRDFPNYEKWFTPEALLGASIVTEYAAKLPVSMRDVLLVALSSKMRSIGNVDVDVVRAEYRHEPRKNVEVLRHVRAQLKKMAAAVDAMRDSHLELGPTTETKIIEGNILDASFDPGSIAHVVTSPPYGVESLSYLRTHLLSFRCLEPFLHADPYATGTGVIGSEYVDGLKAPVGQSAGLNASMTLDSFFAMNLYEDNPKLKRRAAMMMGFFEDMRRLADRLSLWMRPGGCVAFVIGNKRLGDHVIPADKIVAELFTASGFEIHEALEHKLKTNNSNSQVPWQERIIQNEYVLIMSKL